MGFWSWLLKDMNTRDETITPPVSDVLLKALLNNEVITREKALTLPVVSGAVDFITNSVASMPVKLYKVKQGKVEEQPDDIRVKLLNSDTGDTLDGFQLKKAMVEDYLLGKGGYCYIQRDRNDVVALRYVEDQYITILKNFKPIYKDYEILVEGQSYEPYEFIKLLRNTKDGGSGTGLTTEVSKALETAYQTLIYQLSQVQAGGNKKGFLKSQRTLGQEEINALKKAWKNMYGNGQDNVVVLNNGIEFQESGASAIDMQLDQNKNTLRSEINYIFHINEHDFDLTFKEAIYPIIKAFETALNRDLLLEKEKKNYFFEFDVKEIVKASLTERYNAYKTAKETGWLTYNEIRRMENMEYVDGLDVVNVGLGAVLYDINTHKYYTPNTDTVSDPNDSSGGGETPEEAMDTMLEHHELVEAYDESGNSAERQIRYNENHDGKTGRFAPKTGGGGGGVVLSDEDQARLTELEAQLQQPLGIITKSRIKTEIDMIKEGFKGTQEEYNAMKKEQHEKAVQESLAKQKEEKEARQKKIAEQAQKNEQEYMMEHRPSKSGITADNIVKQDVETPMPKDMYDKPDLYFDTSQKSVQESLSALKKIKGNPDAKVKVYRATVGDTINDGDWVTLSKSYAKEHNDHSLGGNGKILEMTVSAKDIQFAGDDINEWGYFPESKSSKRALDNLRYNDVHDSKTGRFGAKDGGLKALANEQSWEQFRNNMNDREMIAVMKENGIMSPKALRDYWVNEKYNSFTKNDAKEITKEEAIEIVRNNVDQNTLNGWFVNADSDYKEKIETAILDNKELRNAGLNIAYHNYKESGNDVSFDEFVNKEQKMYRGERGQQTIEADKFKSFTPDRKVAERFGNEVTEISIKPIDTLGSLQTTGEYEYLVPTNKIRR